MALRDLLQECRELGVGGTAYRVAHELRMRSGLAAWFVPESPGPTPASPGTVSVPRALPFAGPRAVAAALRPWIADADVTHLQHDAHQDAHGRVRCFGRWTADLGDPVDWMLHPVSGRRWNASAHWSVALADAATIGDVKLTWEAARFPQAYRMARAAALDPASTDPLWAAFAGQVQGFLAASPYPLGPHWNSGQECVIRAVAWLFAIQTFGALGADTHPLMEPVGRYLRSAGTHIEHEIGYARRAVYNNHLITEALGLYLIGWLLPHLPESPRWQAQGRRLLDQQADRQFYVDGAYINQSHTYHRVVLQEYLLATVMVGADNQVVPPPWRGALERSLDFLLAHQNTVDGRLPNYGSNDGSHPRVLSTCDFTDFRPVLQAVSLATRGERVYPQGPWDEEAAWLLGPAALEAPVRARSTRSVSFTATGYHVLRAPQGESLATFRCGALRDRFSQIDMLHVDVWWRGLNVLVDAGSYLYNGPAAWHDHFFRTASHNTVSLDGVDQMLHHRRFKVLYWTRAETLHMEQSPRGTVVTGEHHGYQRAPVGCVHRRSVWMASNDLWIVADRVTGTGEHTARLHWLAGPYAFTRDTATAPLALHTPHGDFQIAAYDPQGQPLAGDVVVGQHHPPRGWLSRYYGERCATPSLVFEQKATLPWHAVTVLSAGTAAVTCRDGQWEIVHEGQRWLFVIRDGALVPLA